MTKLTLALPSKGAIAEPTYNFLNNSGLSIHKPNPRQYVGSIPAIPKVNVLFQRVKDVLYKVADGTAHIGVTGYDVVCENMHENIVVIHKQLGYGDCQLVVAAPQSWVDVTSMYDLAEVAIDLREHNSRNLRVATTYVNQARQFLHQHSIHHFTLVKAEGAIEAAPTLGYADIIVDLTQTGTTLRENQLKIIPDGIIVESQACLIGNRQALQNEERLELVRTLLEYIDAGMNSRNYYQLTTNISGVNEQTVAQKVIEQTSTRGLLSPTVSPIYGNSDGKQWYMVTVVIHRKDLLKAIEHLRTIGGAQTVVNPIRYLFLEHSPTFLQLLKQLNPQSESET